MAAGLERLASLTVLLQMECSVAASYSGDRFCQERCWGAPPKVIETFLELHLHMNRLEFLLSYISIVGGMSRETMGSAIYFRGYDDLAHYSLASPGNTSPNFSDDLTKDLLSSLSISLFHDDPYMKVIQAYDVIPPPQVIIALPAIVPPPMFDSQDFFPPEKISPPKDAETPVESPIPISPSSSVRSSSPVRVAQQKHSGPITLRSQDILHDYVQVRHQKSSEQDPRTQGKTTILDLCRL
ncbi:hypothetical protein Tco_0870557 [Tanacetum coccineum]